MHDLPGVTLDALLTTGRYAETWRGRDLAGVPVRCHLVAAPPPGAAQRAAEVLRDVAALASPHLGSGWLAGSTGAAGSVAAVVEPDLPALARPGDPGFTDGQLVTAVAPVAAALGVVHAQGLAHGAIDATALRVTDDGRPVLAGIGVAALAGAPADPAADVAALARVALRLRAETRLYAGRDGGDTGDAGARVTAAAAVGAVLRRAADGELDAAALAAALLDATPAAPLHLPHRPDRVRRDAPDGPPQRRIAAHPASRVRRLRWAPALLLAAVAGAAVAVGRAPAAPAAAPALPALPATPPAARATVSPVAASPAPPPRRPHPRAGSAAVTDAGQWRRVAAALERRRAAALRRGAPELLRGVYVAGAAALRRDAAGVRRLGRLGPVRGLRLRVRRVRPVVVTPTTADVVVVDERSAYRVGARWVPARGPVRWLLRLHLVRGEWRVAAVRRAPG